MVSAQRALPRSLVRKRLRDAVARLLVMYLGIFSYKLEDLHPICRVQSSRHDGTNQTFEIYHDTRKFRSTTRLREGGGFNDCFARRAGQPGKRGMHRQITAAKHCADQSGWCHSFGASHHTEHHGVGC